MNVTFKISAEDMVVSGKAELLKLERLLDGKYVRVRTHSPERLSGLGRWTALADTSDAAVVRRYQYGIDIRVVPREIFIPREYAEYVQTRLPEQYETELERNGMLAVTGLPLVPVEKVVIVDYTRAVTGYALGDDGAEHYFQTVRLAVECSAEKSDVWDDSAVQEILAEAKLAEQHKQLDQMRQRFTQVSADGLVGTILVGGETGISANAEVPDGYILLHSYLAKPTKSSRLGRTHTFALVLVNQERLRQTQAEVIRVMLPKKELKKFVGKDSGNLERIQRQLGVQVEVF